MKQRLNAEDPDRLKSDVEWAIAHRLDARELVRMLEKLVRCSTEGSESRLFANRHLAELVVRDQPWRAALLAREVLDSRECDRAWAVLGLAHTLLGNYRAAARAYRRAIALVPDCPWYAHNLGHLTDVALDRPKDALPLLAAAFRAEPGEVEIAGSYAHALARVGRRDQARSILRAALDADDATAEALLADWLTRDPPGSLPR